MEEWFGKLGINWNGILGFFWKVLLCFVVFWVGKYIIRWIMRFFKKSFEKGKMEPGVRGFLLGLIRCGLWVALVFALIEILGVGVSAILAIASTASLSIGLALQGSLSNFAGGVLILVMKPFMVGDYVETGTNAGVVTNIDIFYTKLLTPDNRVVVIPNGTLSNSSMINVTGQKERRIDITLPISYEQPVEPVKLLLRSIAEDEERILTEDHEVETFLDSFGESGVIVGLRFWVRKTDYWPVKWEIQERIKTAFDGEGIEIPYQQIDVNLKQEKK